jgi:hypothetical protein
MHPGAGRRVWTESRPRGFWLVGWPDSNPRLSPPALRQRNSASTYHDKNDDDGERFCHAQSLAAVIPKLKHALASIQSAPSTEKISRCRKHMPLRPMLRFVARGLIARQNDICRGGIEAASIRASVLSSEQICGHRSCCRFGGYVMHPLPAAWLPVSIAPSDGDLEVCALDYDGIVHALVFPCRIDGAQWVDASNGKRVDIQPTYWRKWNDRH